MPRELTQLHDHLRRRRCLHRQHKTRPHHLGFFRRRRRRRRRRRLGHKPDDAVYLELEIVQRGKLVDGGPDAE